MKGRLVALLAAFVLLGCAAPQAPQAPTVPAEAATPPVFEVSAPFDQKEAARLIRQGPNTIKGHAFMRVQDGAVVTCASQTAYLIPATAYARQRMLALYNNAERGVIAARVYYKFVPDPPEYRTLMRTAKCDAKGNFIFDRVSDGTFFVAVLVSWQVDNSHEGHQLMQRVSVRGGQTSSVAMGP